MRKLAAQAAIPAALLLSIAVIKWLNPWEELFEVRTRAYLLYHLARLLFLLVLPILVYTAGRLLMPSFAALARTDDCDRLDHFVITSAAGAGLLSVGTVLLAAVHLLYPGLMIAIALGLALLAAHRIAELNDWWARRGVVWRALWGDSRGWWSLRRLVMLLLLALLAVAAADLLLKRGMVPYLNDNDVVGTYLPSYEDILFEEHGFFPTIWFIHYYTAKGIGLQFFGMSLTDIFSSQLVNLYLFALAGLVLSQCLRRIGAPPAWLVTALMFYCLSPMAAASFIKNHVALSAYLVLFFFLCVKLLLASPESRGLFFRALLVLCVSNVVFFPMSSLICLGLLGATAILALITGRTRCLKGLVWSGGVVLAALCLVYGFNYWQSGLMDMATMLLDRVFDREVFSQWSSEMVLRMQRHFNQGEGYFSPTNLTSWSTWRWALSQVAGLDYPQWPHMYPSWLLIGLCLLLGAVLAVREPLRGARARLAASPGANIFLLCLGGLTMVLLGQAFYVHGALGRATKFSCVFFVLATAGALHFLMQRITWPNLRDVVRISAPLGAVAVLGMVLATSNSSPFQATAAIKTWKAFLAGKGSYFDVVNETWPIGDEWHIQKNVLPGRRIICLNFRAGAWSLPRGGFLRPLKNVYKRDLPTVLYGSPEEALAALRKYGIEHAIVDVRDHKMITAMAPLFSVENLRRNGRLVWRGGEQGTVYLISFRSEEGAPLADEPEFFAEYSQKRNLPGHRDLYAYGKTLLVKGHGARP